MKLRYPVALCVIMFLGIYLIYDVNIDEKFFSLYGIILTIAVMGTIAYSIYTFVKFVFREVKEVMLARNKEPQKNKEPWE